jgi:serine O-acetyltransferase
MSKIIWYIHKISFWLFRIRLNILANLFVLLNRLIFSIYISPQARISGDVKFGYQGLGIVIGGNTRIGPNVEISHNVTLGGRHITGDEVGQRFPDLEADCYVGPGSFILGKVFIGRTVVIGAGSIVLHSLEGNSVYVGSPVKFIRKISGRIVGDQYVL